jgi:hypothetical protein
MVLPLMLIFKGQPSRHIARTEFAIYPATHHYQCQANEWMDEVCMIAWVNEMLAPYLATALDDVVPLLVLNSYQCHMMALVVQMIQELWGGGEAHPRRMHSPMPACQCWLK